MKEAATTATTTATLTTTTTTGLSNWQLRVAQSLGAGEATKLAAYTELSRDWRPPEEHDIKWQTKSNYMKRHKPNRRELNGCNMACNLQTVAHGRASGIKKAHDAKKKN